MISQVVASEREIAQILAACCQEVVGLQCGIYKYSGMLLERCSIEGDSPVHEIFMLPSSTLSTAGPEKSCGNLPAPSGKAKYYWETDSEQVPWGKGEKNREQRSEIGPETIRLQAEEAQATSCLLHNEPTSYTSLARLILCKGRAAAKASLNRAT